jgi:hypothetical protein
MLVFAEIEVTVLLLLLLLGLLSGRYIFQRLSANTSHNQDFNAFQRTYLVGYLLVMMADALQGPYLYRLLHHYQLVPVRAQLISGRIHLSLFLQLLRRR